MSECVYCTLLRFTQSPDYRGSVCSLYKLTGSADKAGERIRAAMRCECVQCIYFTFMLFLNR